MKKFLALLMCAAMLFSATGAMAATTRFDLTMDVSAAPAEAVTKGLCSLLGVPESQEMTALTDTLMRLLDGAGVVCSWQEDAVYLEVLLGGKSFLDMTFSMMDGRVVMTSTLMPRYALYAEVPGDETVVLYADAEALLRQLRTTARFWLKDVKATETRGAFSGDAYDGGAVCTTYAFDDAKVASLVRGLLSDYILQTLTASFGEECVAQLLAATNDMAGRNTYRYLLRLVEDAQGAFVGGSITVLQGDDQVGTLSVGMSDGETKLVMGLGLPEENYWYDLSAAWVQQDGQTSVSGTAREWLAPGDETYAYAEAFRQPVTTFDWSGSMQDNAADLTVTDGASTLLMTLAACDPIAVSLEGKTLVDTAAGENDPLYQRAMRALTQGMTARLLTVIPMDVLLQFMLNP